MTSLLVVLPLFSAAVLAQDGKLASHDCLHDRDADGHYCGESRPAGRHVASRHYLAQLQLAGIVESRPKVHEPRQAGVTIHAGRVIDVTADGTLVLLERNREIRIRLADIKTPADDQPYAAQARQVLSDLVIGKSVRAKVEDTDRHGYSVARVHVGSTDVNAEMVSRGAAWVRHRQYAKDKSLYAIEQHARNTGQGLWALPEAAQVPPWAWSEHGQ